MTGNLIPLQKLPYQHDRTDESEASCLWSIGLKTKQELFGSLETCNEGTLEEGLLCGQECVPYDEWCTSGTKVRTFVVECVAFLCHIP